MDEYEYNFDDNIFKDTIINKLESLVISQMDREELFRFIIEACEDSYLDGYGTGSAVMEREG